MQPEKMLETLNDRLCIGNDANLFVTLFCGFLDVESGSFVYSNGGHCAPMVCSGREAALLPLPQGHADRRGERPALRAACERSSRSGKRCSATPTA